MYWLKSKILWIVCVTMIFSLSACGSRNSEKDAGAASANPSAQFANPFTDCDNLEEAEKLAGFDLSLPEKLPEGFAQDANRAIKGEMIEIIYRSIDDEIRIRKAKGNEDISGDYNVYQENQTVTIGEIQATTKGNDGKINVAVWNVGDYTFAITASTAGEGLESGLFIELIQDTK